MSAAVVGGRLQHGARIASLRGGRLEALKWSAFALMVLEHYVRYVIGLRDPAAEFLGAMVLPTFAFAFAVGAASSNIDRRENMLLRLLGWAAVAQLAAMLVRDLLPLNVLFVFAAALALDVAADSRYVGWYRVALVALACVLATLSEFAVPGVALVFALLRWARDGRGAWLALVACALAVIAYADHSLGAVLAPAFVAALLWSGAELPRRRGVFYAAYAAQFVALGGLAWLLR